MTLNDTIIDNNIEKKKKSAQPEVIRDFDFPKSIQHANLFIAQLLWHSWDSATSKH